MQFELPDLADACWEYIDECLKSGRGENLLKPTRAYSQHKTAQLIFDRVSLYTTAQQTTWTREPGVVHQGPVVQITFSLTKFSSGIHTYLGETLSRL